MKCPEQAHPERERIRGRQGAGGEGDGEITAEGQWAQGFFLGQKCSKAVMTFVQLSECAKITELYTLKKVNFMACALYLQQSCFMFKKVQQRSVTLYRSP